MNNNNIITHDIYVVDYTEYLKSHPDADTPTRGVAFLSEPDDRLHAFYVENPNKVAYTVLNLEEHPSLTTDGEGKMIKQPECILEAYRKGRGKRWILLLELKYPHKEANIAANMQSAFAKFQ